MIDDMIYMIQYDMIYDIATTLRGELEHLWQEELTSS